MKLFFNTALLLILLTGSICAQDKIFEKLEFLLGSWQGTGSGFGNTRSEIRADYQLVMEGRYITVEHNSKFEPTEKNTRGENHIDRGMISFDKTKGKII